MSQNKQGVEPALIWSMGLFMGVIALLGRISFSSYTYTPDVNIPLALQCLAGVYGALGLALAGAMGEPLPQNPREGYVPWRLTFCWGILGFCPPPARWFRVAGVSATSALYVYPLSDIGLYGLAAVASAVLGGWYLRKPKGILVTEAYEWFYILGLCALGLGAIGTSAGGSSGEAWRGVAVLGSVAVLAGQRAREVAAAQWAQLLPGIPPPPALDLSRYEVSVERQGTAERPALPPGAEEQLVDSGSFRVDAAKMFDKLREHQLADPRDFILAWLRCAAASGARHIGLRSRGARLELTFEGRPFSAAELSQPYQALIDSEGDNGKRGRHFAYGLLALYRLRPLSVSVTSRGPGGVATMKAGAGLAPDPDSAPAGTSVVVTWPAWAYYWRPTSLTWRARRNFGLGPAALSVNGRQVPSLPLGPDWRTMHKDGWRAAANAAEPSGRVRLYTLGTFIEEIEYDRGAPAAWLAFDDFELNISQSSVVRGECLNKGLTLFAAEFV